MTRDTVTLRPVLAGDAELLFRWQCMPEIRRFARNPIPPSWGEHVEWLQRKLADKNAIMNIILYGDRPAGTLRLDRRDRKETIRYEVSILIDIAYQKMGVGYAALAAAAVLVPMAPLLAKVLPDNVASRKLFQSAGYQPLRSGWWRLPPRSSA